MTAIKNTTGKIIIAANIYLCHMSRPPVNDYGFSTQVGAPGARLINPDGSFNVVRRGLAFSESFSIYHSLINMPWKAFYAVVFCAYFCVNSLFSLLYLALGISHLEGTSGTTAWQHFADAFFFSSQTLTTVGYGHVHPAGFWTSALAAFESMCGLLAFAIATGLLFARFSRPQAKIVHSDSALIAPYRDGRGFMLRIANARKHPLIEVEVQVGLSWIPHGENKRHFHELPLERHKINFFALTWTIVHPIDERSPLASMTPAQLVDVDGEFFVWIKAYDESFNQTVYARFSYKPGEVVWGARFVRAFSHEANGITYVDLHRLSQYEEAILPPATSVGKPSSG
jgi:inward rectifier potassium channel